MGEQPVSSQSADAGVGQQAARRSAMSRCSRRQFRRLFGAYGRAKGRHMAIVPARGWRGRILTSSSHKGATRAAARIKADCRAAQ